MDTSSLYDKCDKNYISYKLSPKSNAPSKLQSLKEHSTKSCPHLYENVRYHVYPAFLQSCPRQQQVQI